MTEPVPQFDPQFDPQSDPRSISTSERRKSERKPVEDRISIRIDTFQMEGTASNLSDSGILFFTDGEMKVTIEVVEESGPKSYTGNLVRCECIKDNRRGWAVEFDEAE